MAKIVHVVCSATVLILLSDCGEHLASNAQKAADKTAAEAIRTATKELGEFKGIAARPVPTGLFVPKKVAAKIVWA